MNTQIQKLKDGNHDLFAICDDIDSYFSHIEHKLKVINSEFIVLSKLNKASLHSYCLDSIQFQLRLYTNYLSNHKNTYSNIQNQIYRDYYKLYKLISRYIHSHITDKKVLMLVETDTFPIYKDLDILFVYEKQTVDSIYDTLINIINSLNEFCNSKQESLAEQQKLVDRGYDIENLISSHNYTREVVVNHIRLYIDYLCYFKKYKKKYLSELYSKITTLYYEIPPIEIMKNMTAGSTIKFDNSNNNLDNDNLLPFLPQSPTKKTTHKNNEHIFNSNNNNVTTFVNELKYDHIENENINNNDGFLVSPTNSEVSSMNDNIFNEENIKKNTDTDTDTDTTKENIIENTTVINSETALTVDIVDTVVIPKKKRGRPKKHN
jgi:hypothetical protein